VSRSDRVFVNGVTSPDKTMIVATFWVREDDGPPLAKAS
jgi:hypothetical protein